MEIQNESPLIPLWYGKAKEDNITIEQWLEKVQEAKGN